MFDSQPPRQVPHHRVSSPVLSDDPHMHRQPTGKSRYGVHQDLEALLVRIASSGEEDARPVSVSQPITAPCELCDIDSVWNDRDSFPSDAQSFQMLGLEPGEGDDPLRLSKGDGRDETIERALLQAGAARIRVRGDDERRAV